MSDDSRTSRQVQVLKDLGLSRAESEVYLACLRLAAAGTGLLSSYRVAQDMGRDPANIGKIVNTLVHLQAVRVVQEKPRLFMAVPPGEFTDHVLGRLRRRGAEAVSLLEDFSSPEAEGVPLALGNRDQVLDRARHLIAGARADLLVAGSPEVIRDLGADLEAAATPQGCRVRVVSPQAFTSAVVEVSALPPAGRVGHHPDDGWLAMTADDTHWLVASLPQDRGPAVGPCGWWAGSSPVARIWAEYLETAWRAGVTPVGVGPAAEVAAEIPAASMAPAEEPAAVPDPVSPMPSQAASVPASPAATPGTTPDAEGFVPGAIAAPVADPGAIERAAPEPVDGQPSAPSSPWARPIPAAEAEQAGFSFLFKHDRRRDGTRGER